jgi:hypothetical protein
VVQLASGRLVVPVALHNRPEWIQPDWRGEITCYLSDDAGQTWRRAKTMQKAFDRAGTRITAQEPGVVELSDGRLLMWVRTNAGEQYRCVSTDGGETWSDLEPMGVASPLSPASIERIPNTGHLLLVWNDHSHVPLGERKARTPFSVGISRDEAATWELVQNLDTDPKGWFCYTAIEFVDEHLLLAHVAGQQQPGMHLATTRITRMPIELLDEPAR